MGSSRIRTRPLNKNRIPVQIRVRPLRKNWIRLRNRPSRKTISGSGSVIWEKTGSVSFEKKTISGPDLREKTISGSGSVHWEETGSKFDLRQKKPPDATFEINPDLDPGLTFGSYPVFTLKKILLAFFFFRKKSQLIFWHCIYHFGHRILQENFE